MSRSLLNSLRHRDPRTVEFYDLTGDQRRKRALNSLEELEQRGRQTSARRKRVAKLRKSPDSSNHLAKRWWAVRDSNPGPSD